MPKLSKARPHPWEAVTPRELSDADRRAIFSVCDCVIGGAGRTSVMMALRGSRSEKMRRLGLVDYRGHGHFAGMSEDEVLARIDTLIHEGLLADRGASEATAEWLPLVQAWSAAEIRRVRERLAPVIERLVRGG